MTAEILKTIRAVLYVGGALVLVYLAAPIFKPKPAAPVIQQPQSATVQQVIEAAKQIATLQGGKAPITAMPAVTIVRDVIPQAKGLSDAEIAAILGATKPKTHTVVSADSTLVGPSPVPIPTKPPDFTPSQSSYIYDASYAATTAAINASHVDTNIRLHQEDVQPGRVGTFIYSNGDSGLSFDVLRRNQLNATIAAVAHGSAIRPVVSLTGCLKHTSLCGGPAYEVGHSLGFGVSLKL